MISSQKRFLKSLILYFIIILSGFLVYFKTLFYDITFLDDNVWILDYQWFIKNFSNLPQLFIKPDLISGLFYRPLLNLSFMINAYFSGTVYFQYHLTNVIIHVFNACLLFLFLKELNYKKELAYAFSIIFSVHPVLTQAVAWIPGRTDSLLCLFVLISVISFIKYLKYKRTAFAVFHFIFLVFSLLVKETAIVLPVICFLYVQLIYKKEYKDVRKVPFKISWIFIVTVWLLIRYFVLKNARHVGIFIMAESIFHNLPAVISYAGKIIIPINLSVLPIIEDMNFLYGIAAIILLSLMLFSSKNKRNNYVMFGICWFLFFLIPSLVLSFIKHEYRLYLPIMGFIIIMLETDFINKLSFRRRNLFLFFLPLIVFLSIITLRYSENFSNRMVFWQSAVKTSPHSPLAHRNLGAMYHLEGMLDEAEREYIKSIEINPFEPMVHNNLGIINFSRGRIKEAERFYIKEIEVNPTYDNVYFNLGNLYYNLHMNDKAAALWKRTIELNPRYISAYKNLGLYYVKKGEMKKAAHYLNTYRSSGLDLSPEFEELLKKYSF